MQVATLSNAPPLYPLHEGSKFKRAAPGGMNLINGHYNARPTPLWGVAGLNNDRRIIINQYLTDQIRQRKDMYTGYSEVQDQYLTDQMRRIKQTCSIITV